MLLYSVYLMAVLLEYLALGIFSCVMTVCMCIYYLPIQFSKLVGFDITPDSGTTLRKMLKNNFTPFLEQMESISAGASKASFLLTSERSVIFP